MNLLYIIYFTYFNEVILTDIFKKFLYINSEAYYNKLSYKNSQLSSNLINI